jgi:hypothetical protein
MESQQMAERKQVIGEPGGIGCSSIWSSDSR